MKKVVLSVFAISTMMAFVSCGPSAEELAKKTQATADSLAAVAAQQHMEDSLAMVAEAAKAGEAAMADSLAKVAVKAHEDSLAAVAAGAKNTVKKIVKKTVAKVTNGGRAGAVKEGAASVPVKSVGGNGGRAGATKQ